MANEFQLKALITGVDKLSPALKGIRKNIKGWERDLKSAGEGAPALGMGLAAAVGGSLAAFAQSENAATGLKVAMMDASGAVGPEFKKINDLAVGLGNKLPGTTADFQNMMTMLQRQGLSAETVLSGVGEATAYLAVQLGKTPEAAAEFAAKMQDATGTTSKDMMSLFDTIQKAFYMGVDDNNMLQFFGKASSAMKLVSKDGLKAAQAMAPLAIMLDQASMAGESAGNAMRKVMTAGFDRKKMKEANQMIRSMGLKGAKLDFTDGKGEFGGLDNMFAQLEKLKGLTEGDKLTVLGKIFGTDSETQQALKTIIDKGKAGYDEIQKKMERQASLQKRVEEQLGTLQNLWDAMTGTAINGLAAIGGAFKGEAKDTVKFLADMGEKFQAFADANPAVVRGVVAAVGAFTAMKLALYGAGIAMQFLGKATMATPLGIIMTGIALAAGLIIANWDKLGPWVIKLWDSIVVVVSAAFDVLKALFFNFTPLGVIVKNWGAISEWFTQFWDGNQDLFGFHMEEIKQAFLNFTPLGLIIKNWDPIVDYFKGLWEKVMPYLQPMFDAVTWLGGDKLAQVGDAASGAWDTASNALSKIWGGGSSPIGQNSPLSAVSPATGANANGGRVAGEMVVRFENAPQNLRVDEGKSSPGWSMLPDVGYSRYAK